MTTISFYQLILYLSLISYCISEEYINRYRRQIVVDGPNRNTGVPQQRPPASIPLNNLPINPSNNPNIIISNERINQQPQQQQQQQQQPINNNYLLGPSQQQQQQQLINNNYLPGSSQSQQQQQQPINTNYIPGSSQQQQQPPVRSGGFYNSPAFQPPPFTGEKPSGWFGTNHINWVSNRESEVDKNRLSGAKTAAPNTQQFTVNQPRREDGGINFLQKVARQYASKGEKAFKPGPYETPQGPGSYCSNHENFDGFRFGEFSCPLPPSTGMNQLDQFCCGPANYQYCCNVQEFSQTQRGAYSDNMFMGDRRFPKQADYPPATRKILAVMIPIASFIVLSGIIAVVFLYYKKFRNAQNRSRKPAGSIRLEENYSVVPQESAVERQISSDDEQ